mmetsp:Transcript_102446/g.293297  ORF Transcript_102446/g.293297 Transcript_102446/m.293297 type:complete len:99 (-) Transcript_102446:410-706(-)
MLEKAKADKAGKADVSSFYAKQVDMFTDQLVEANPILTAISDAMTGEGDANIANDAALAASWAAKKEEANGQLQTLSEKYNAMMKAHRQGPAAACLSV